MNNISHRMHIQPSPLSTITNQEALRAVFRCAQIARATNNRMRFLDPNTPPFTLREPSQSIISAEIQRVVMESINNT